MPPRQGSVLGSGGHLSSASCSGLILLIGHPHDPERPANSQIIDLRHKRERLIAIIRRQSLLRNRDFILTSGRSSNFFFDMKRTMFDPEGAALLADLLFDAIKAEDVEYIGGLETGAI